MTDESNKRPQKRDFVYWAVLVCYVVLGIPLVFTVASHVLMAPLLALKLLDPPKWLDSFVFTPLGYFAFAVSAYCVWWGWKLVSRQLASRAA